LLLPWGPDKPAVTIPTVVITGFGRFPGSPSNPSGRVATGLTARRRPSLADTRRVAHVFATRYARSTASLPN
jgi:pyroglutamyl-peptidase